MEINKSPFSIESDYLRARIAYATLSIFLVFLFIVGRLWYLQVFKGEEFRVLSENNRTRVQDLLPTRGLILDATGRILVDNYPAYDLGIVRENVRDAQELKLRLSRLLNMPLSRLDKAFKEARSTPSFKPALIRADLAWEELAALEVHRFELPGTLITIRPRRKYLNESLAAHAIGYLGEVNTAQLKKDEWEHKRVGDLVGQCGVEQAWESALEGRRGYSREEVDAFGRVQRVIERMPATPGHNLHLTIIAQLQKAAEKALAGKAGAIVALEAQTGRVLAMASSPSFSQEDFVQGISPAKWRALVNHPLHPLENRVISGQYMPGSTFKIVSALAALEEGIVTPSTKITCTGAYAFGNRLFRCWKAGGHGAVDLHRAIVESCDVYFYDIGKKIGIDTLAKYSRMLGLGEKTGLGVGSEKSGLVPTAEWKKRRTGEPWQQGENLSVIIGQGYNLATPLQMARMVAAVVNGGYLYKPFIARQVTDAEGEPIETYEPQLVRRLDIAPESLELVKQALAGVVSEPGGTGGRARVRGVRVGGKTGTAQVVAQAGVQEDDEDIPYRLRDHAWFVAFAPVKDPVISVAVIVEHGGHGSSAAAPLAQKVLDVYFNQLDKPAAAVAQAPGPARGALR